MLFSIWSRIGFAVLGDSGLNIFLCSMFLSIFVARGGVDGIDLSVGKAIRGRFMAWHGSSTSGAVGMRVAARIRLGLCSIVAWLLAQDLVL